MHVHKSKEPAYMLIFLPCYIPWSSQVHLVLVGINFVGVLYHGIVIADLGAATEPRVPYVC
jgi:hypothetical protein